MAENSDSAKRKFDHRDAIIRDRLWQMKKAAIDIFNLIDIPMEYGVDCDGTCDSCPLSKIQGVHCSALCDIETMEITEVS